MSNIHGQGVVHGHIHNYNTLTYIHGHVHRVDTKNIHDVKPLDNDNNDDFLSGNVTDDNDGFNYLDCQHFEFINYHDLLDGNNNNNNNFTNSILDNTVPDLITGKTTQDLYDDDLLLKLPSKKKQKILSNNDNTIDTKKISCKVDECIKKPKVLEVCCNMEHNCQHNNNIMNNISDTKNGYSSDDNVISDLNVNCPFEGINIYTDPLDINKLANNGITDINNISSNNNTNNEPLQNFSDFTLIKSLPLNQLPIIDCDLTCEQNTCTSHNESSSSSSSSILEDTFISPTKVSDSNESTSSLTIPSHDHIANSKMDFDIMDDLCKMSSLYELPFTQHINHTTQNTTATSTNTTSPDINNNNDNKPKSFEVFNLLKNFPSNNDPNHHKSHHHHTIHLHNHGLNQTAKFITKNSSLSKGLSSSSICNTSFQDQCFSFERSTGKSQSPSPASIKLQHSTSPLVTINGNMTSTLTSNNKLDVLQKENNVIDFNWNFKNETDDTNNNIICKWDNCQQRFENLFDLQKHILHFHLAAENYQKDVNNFDCQWKDCSTKSDNICSLVNHINNKHGINFDIKYKDPNTEDALQKEQRLYHHIFHCDQKDSHQHQLKKSFQNKKITTNTSDSKQVKLQCMWDNCQFIFSTPEELTSHLENFHLDKGKNHYKCKWEGCCKSFKQRQKISRHLLTHTGYKPFKCDECKKCFGTRETLTQHLRTHSGEKPYKCDVCGKCFSISSSLKIHMRTHTGERPFTCNVCGKSFSESSNYNKHLRIHQSSELSKKSNPKIKV